MSYPVYEDKPVYDFWIKALLVGVVLLMIVAGFVEMANATGEAFKVFGIAIFVVILFRTILPRRFQILDDRVKIVLGGPFSINIPLSDITDARPRTGIKAFYYTGIRFGTSASHTIVIERRNGLNILFSPSDPTAFLEKLDQARGSS